MAVHIEKLRVGFIAENCYVLRTGTGPEDLCILVDPGDEADAIVAWLDSLGLVPSIIVATHGHLDHIAAIPGVRQAFLARGAATAIPLAAHRGDAAYFGARSESTNRELFRSIRASAYFTHFWHPIPDPDTFLADGDILPGTEFRVLHTPGHSPGSLCLHSAADAILVSGDTLFRDGVGRTDASDADEEILGLSLDRLLRLPADTRVFPGHGEETTVGREARRHSFR